MKKSVLLSFLIAISMTSFGQELPFRKVKLSDSIAISKEMKQLAALCNTQNLSDLDLQ